MCRADILNLMFCMLYILAFRFVATEYDSILMDTQIVMISG